MHKAKKLGKEQILLSWCCMSMIRPHTVMSPFLEVLQSFGQLFGFYLISGHSVKLELF